MDVEPVQDETALLRAKQRSNEFNRRYGEAIKKLRELHPLTQMNIEDKTGLTDRHLRRIEKGETRATSKALEQLAEAHGMSMTDYMNKLAELLE